MGALVMETLSTVFPKAHEKNLFRASLGRMPFGFRYGGGGACDGAFKNSMFKKDI